jgi:hypothetical protein
MHPNNGENMISAQYTNFPPTYLIDENHSPHMPSEKEVKLGASEKINEHTCRAFFLSLSLSPSPHPHETI